MDTSPCREHGCSECCVGTSMTLTEADVARLEKLGRTDFYRENANGDLQLLNRNGSCVFLTDSGCGVYDARPEGCRLYPLVFDVGRDKVVRDGFCRWMDAVPLPTDGERRLRRSVADEVREAARRRAVRDPWDR